MISLWQLLVSKTFLPKMSLGLEPLEERNMWSIKCGGHWTCKRRLSSSGFTPVAITVQSRPDRKCDVLHFREFYFCMEKREGCKDMFAGPCLSVNQATIRLCICICTSVLTWDVKAKKAAICLQRWGHRKLWKKEEIFFASLSGLLNGQAMPNRHCSHCRAVLPGWASC